MKNPPGPPLPPTPAPPPPPLPPSPPIPGPPVQDAEISADASPPNTPLSAIAVSWLQGLACATDAVDTIHPAVRAAPQRTPSIFFFMSASLGPPPWVAADSAPSHVNPISNIVDRRSPRPVSKVLTGSKLEALMDVRLRAELRQADTVGAGRTGHAGLVRALGRDGGGRRLRGGTASRSLGMSNARPGAPVGTCRFRPGRGRSPIRRARQMGVTRIWRVLSVLIGIGATTEGPRGGHFSAGDRPSTEMRSRSRQGHSLRDCT